MLANNCKFLPLIATESIEAQWASYLPQQYDLVQNYKVEVKDNKVIFVISEVADQIIEKFNAAQ